METTQRRAVLLSPSSFLLRLNFLFEAAVELPHTRTLTFFHHRVSQKLLGLAINGERGWFYQLCSQLCLKNTVTNMIAPMRGSIPRWKMRYTIYLRFLVFDKIESSHFNCSRRGVLPWAMETWALCVVPCSLQTIILHCAKHRLWIAVSLSSILFRII